ncbi:MAG: hypothetical protein QNJ90_05795 [Planctomycetota bacterium]|nr:hypothetical protein [Planctomycetota bacterium]
MRFLLFDRITELEPGKHVRGVKCVSLTEEFLRDHFTRTPCMPGSLVIEAMVQLTAWCAIAKHDYALSCVLSMLDDVQVPADLPPGTTLHIEGELLGTNPKGSFAKARATVDGQEVARIGRVLYAHVPMPDPEILRERLRYFGGTP